MAPICIATPHFGQFQLADVAGACGHLLRLRGDCEQLANERQISRPVASCREAIQANADETMRQNTLGEAPQKLRGVWSHFALFAAMGIVFPAEGYRVTDWGCAGLNRHVAREEESLQERRKRLHPDPESCD